MLLSSLVTGPNILVAIGSSCLSSKTAAFLSNLIAEPSGLLKSLDVLTITALYTSPFFTLDLGKASFIETTIMSPIEADLRLDPPRTLIHCIFLAPELSATKRLDYICIISFPRY